MAYYAAFILLGLVTASMGPTLSGLARHTQTHLNEVSFLFTARSLGYLLGSMWNGRYYDRRPGHPIMAVCLLVMAAMAFLVPFIPVLWLLTAALLLLGIGEGTLDVGGNTLLIWIHRYKVGPFMNGLHFFFGIGAFISPILVSQAILISGDINWAYWMLAIFILPAAFWLLRLPSPEVQASARDKQNGQINYWLVSLIAVFFFLHVGAEASYGGWIYTYVLRQWNGFLGADSETTAAILNSVFWGSFTLGRLLGIPIATRFKPAIVLFADLIGGVASMAAILIWPHSYPVLWLGSIGIGLSIASLYPTTIAFAGSRMAITGRVTGWFFVGSGAGGMILPWLIGQLFEPVGPHVAMLAILADLILAIGILFAILLVSSKTALAEKTA